ncbi:MAG: biopolymer transporter ExbD [Verrucomicrobiota bacterium]
MKVNRPEIADAEFDITPMIDVVFLLIVFFMVVAAEITNKVDIAMPEADQAVVPEDLGRRLEVTVVETGLIYVGMMPVTLDELSARIAMEKQTVPGFRFFLRADANTPHRHIQSIMDVCQSNEVYDIIFATLQET